MLNYGKVGYVIIKTDIQIFFLGLKSPFFDLSLQFFHLILPYFDTVNYDLEFGLVQEHDEFDLSITYLQTLGPNLFESTYFSVFLQAVYV